MPILGVEATSSTEPSILPRATTQLSARVPSRAPGAPAPHDDPPKAAAPEPQKPPVVDLPDGTSLRFTVDPDTGKTVAALVDPRSGEVLRQVPSAEALELAKRLGKQGGLVLDLKV